MEQVKIFATQDWQWQKLMDDANKWLRENHDKIEIVDRVMKVDEDGSRMFICYFYREVATKA